MTRDEYNRWWIDNTGDDGELLSDLPEPGATLAAHVMALQARIDRLPKSDRCGCAYDNPADVCMTHKQVTE